MVDIYYDTPNIKAFPFRNTIPIPFFPIAGRPLIEHIIAKLDISVDRILLDKDFFSDQKKEICSLAKKIDLEPHFISSSSKKVADAINGYIIPLTQDKRKQLDHPWDLFAIQEGLMKNFKTYNKGEIEDNTTIKGPVIIQDHVKIRNGAYIQGPTFIDEHTTIGPNCYIRPYTYIGKQCYVGNAVEVKNSIILDETHIGHLSYVGDSIIGRRCNFGAGTKVANLKFDNSNVKVTIGTKKLDTGRRKLGVIMADNTKTSINLSIMPGTYVPPNSRLLIKDRVTTSSIIKSKSSS